MVKTWDGTTAGRAGSGGCLRRGAPGHEPFAADHGTRRCGRGSRHSAAGEARPHDRPRLGGAPPISTNSARSLPLSGDMKNRPPDGRSPSRVGQPRREVMVEPEAVTTLLRLHALGWGSKRIARELGISRRTVERYIEAGCWQPLERPRRRRLLEDLNDWPCWRFRRHRGNAPALGRRGAAGAGGREGHRCGAAGTPQPR